MRRIQVVSSDRKKGCVCVCAIIRSPHDLVVVDHNKIVVVGSFDRAWDDPCIIEIINLNNKKHFDVYTYSWKVFGKYSSSFSDRNPIKEFIGSFMCVEGVGGEIRFFFVY